MSVKVVYVAGQAHSGSTILCALLGVHPDMEPLSELAMWSLGGWQRNRTCGCGLPTSECPFWSSLHRAWVRSLNGATLEQYAELQRRVETIWYMWPPAPGRRAARVAEMKAYAGPTTSMFRIAADLSGRPIMVDSSKKPARAAALTTLADLDLTIVHLVRSGLSLVDSHIRTKKGYTPDNPRYLYRVFRTAVRWARANMAAERALQLNRSRGLRLRFEDLISRPSEALEALGSTIGIDPGPMQEHVRAGRPIPFRHMASGSRHRDQGPTPLQPDRAKPAMFDRRTRLAFYAGGGWLARRYGYR